MADVKTMLLAARSVTWGQGGGVRAHELAPNHRLVLLTLLLASDNATGEFRRSVADVTRATGLGRSTVKAALRALIEAGLIDELEPGGGYDERGRPAKALRRVVHSAICTPGHVATGGTSRPGARGDRDRVTRRPATRSHGDPVSKTTHSPTRPSAPPTPRRGGIEHLPDVLSKLQRMDGEWLAAAASGDHPPRYAGTSHSAARAAAVVGAWADVLSMVADSDIDPMYALELAPPPTLTDRGVLLTLTEAMPELEELLEPLAEALRCPVGVEVRADTRSADRPAVQVIAAPETATEALLRLAVGRTRATWCVALAPEVEAAARAMLGGELDPLRIAPTTT